jgi:ethanolamine-phosphate cytidylyltransferase
VSEETLDRYNCQYYAHGDDPVFGADGTDMCAVLRGVGRFKMFKRTEGVSTTDIVGKLLMLTKDNTVQGRKRTGSFEKPMLSSEYVKEVRRIEQEESKKEQSFKDALSPVSAPSLSIPNSHFLATTRRIMHFSNNKESKPTDRIIYIQGSFDLLHNGHIETLKRARAMGDFLYVGVWADDIVNYFRGSNYPLLSLHERVLMVLACKYVDDVVIGSNYQVTKDMIKSLNISKVVHPLTNED